MHEATGAAADALLQGVHVGGALLEGFQQLGADHGGALLEQIFGLRGVNPPSGDDLGTGDDAAAVYVDRHDDHDHALFGQQLAISQDPPADVADDAVHVHIVGADLAGAPHPCIVEGHLVPVFADDDLALRDAQILGNAAMGHQLAVLAVHGDEPTRPHQRVVKLQLAGLGVAGGVDVGDAAVDHFRAQTGQPVDDGGDVVLVAGNGAGGQDHRVVGAYLHAAVLVGGHEGEGRHGLALAAGGDDTHLGRLMPVELLDVDQLGGGDIEEAHVSGHLDVAFHRKPEGGHHPTLLDGRVGDLLDAVDVGGEAGHDEAAVLVLVEQVVEDPTDFALGGGPARLVGVSGVRQQQADALGVSEMADAGQVGPAAVDRGGVDLEVPRMQHDALGGMHRDGVAGGHRVSEGDELDLHRADVHHAVVFNDVERGAAQQPGLFDAVAGQTEGEAGAVKRNGDFAQQEGQAADVVLVAVGEDDGAQAGRVFHDVGEIGQHQVDAGHVGAGEHEPEIDEDHVPVDLKGTTITPDLAETAQKCDRNR